MRRWMMLAAGLAAAPAAQAAEFNQVLFDRSQVAFGYKQMGVPADGRFKRFNALVAFDPARPGAAQADLQVEVASVDTGSAEANEEVKSRGWFNAGQFPTARFVATSVKPLGGNRYEVAGKLTIKNVTREVVTPVTFTSQGNAGQLEGALQIRRADFRIGEGVWSDFDTVANEVQIKFRIAVAAAPAKK